MLSIPGIALRAAKPSDAEALVRIYNHYVLESVVTFEEQAVEAEDFRQRIEEVLGLPLPWLVAEESGVLLGYAYASRWKGRCAYRFASEVTVYLDPKSGGRGIGSLLYAELIEQLKQAGMHALMGGVALPNQASEALHRKFGFEQAAHFKEVGFKFERHVDVAYWQLLL